MPKHVPFIDEDQSLANRVMALWLNEVNIAVFDAIGNGTASPITPADVLANLGLSLPGGSALVGFVQAGTGAVTRTVQAKLRERISVKDFGAVGDGLTNDSAAIQAAIDAGGTGCHIFFPAGTYLITSTLTISQHRVWLQGDGARASIILFNPPANGVCLSFTMGATTMVQSALTDLSLFSTDSIHTKIGIDLVDTSEFKLERVTISGSVVANSTSYWSGASSVGLRTKGKELLQVNGLTIAADKPIQLSQNPNNANIGADHFHFENCYLLANAAPCVTIDTGLAVTQLLFDGYQAWVLGTNGLLWLDTTSVLVSNGITLRNVRREQVLTATDYFVSITHNTGCQNICLDSCYGPGGGRGVFLRVCSDLMLLRNFHSAATLALNVDATVERVSGWGCFWQAGSTVITTGQRMLLAMPKSPATGGLPTNFCFDLAANTTRDLYVGGGLGQTEITIANDGVAEIGPTTSAGMLTVVDSEGLSAEFALKGTNNVATEVSDPYTVYSVTAGTASSTNIYWSAGNSRYEIQNKRGAERRYRILLKGSYLNF